jgi:flagellar biosynthesis/type III secretory pathway protein FliH
MARALVAKDNPVIVQNRAEGHAQGKREGYAEGEREGMARMLLGILDARQIPLDASQRARIRGADPDQLTRWSVRAAIYTTVAAIFDETAGG